MLHSGVLFSEKIPIFPPKFYNFPLTIWQRGRLCAFVTICVSVGVFSILTYDNIGQHEMAFFQLRVDYYIIAIRNVAY